MCHIGTWSTRYCMRTTEKVWGQEEKKIKMVCRVSVFGARQRILFAECQDGWHSAKNFNFF